jgi:hypothetical protein
VLRIFMDTVAGWLCFAKAVIRAVYFPTVGVMASGPGHDSLWLARTPSASSDVMVALAAR